VSAQLDSTAEEEEGGDGALPIVPDVSGSPPHDSKMRQISQGVEDITWKNMAKDPSLQPEKPSEETQQEPMNTDNDLKPAVEEVQVPPLLRGENPPQVLDGDGDEEHAGEADPPEVPPDAQKDGPTLLENIVSTPPRQSSSPPPASPTKKEGSLSRHGSNESLDQEKGLKRKLADRSISERHVPSDLLPEKDDIPSTSLKRLRDDPDKDDNPREPKRPTPPPDGENVSGPAIASSGETTSRLPSTAQAPSPSQETSSTASASASTPVSVSLALIQQIILSLVYLEWLHGLRIYELAIRESDRSQPLLR
jgi:Ran-binding protein 3